MNSTHKENMTALLDAILNDENFPIVNGGKALQLCLVNGMAMEGTLFKEQLVPNVYKFRVNVIHPQTNKKLGEVDAFLEAETILFLQLPVEKPRIQAVDLDISKIKL